MVMKSKYYVETVVTVCAHFFTSCDPITDL